MLIIQFQFDSIYLRANLTAQRPIRKLAPVEKKKHTHTNKIQTQGDDDSNNNYNSIDTDKSVK
jgi:hypothetical protein